MIAGFLNHQPIPIGSMKLVYLPTFKVDFYAFHVGKYTVRPMDPTSERAQQFQLMACFSPPPWCSECAVLSPPVVKGLHPLKMSW